MEIPEILTQNDLNQTFDDKGKEITDISDLVLVHKTNFIPENGVIKSSRDAGALLDHYFDVGGERYRGKHLYERNTVHFCLNGEVSSHSGGNWDKTKYVIITPFDKADKTSLVGGSTVDLYTEGSFVIPEDSYILCPQNEIELVKNMNPTLKTIGYEGEYAKGYGDFFIQLLGYKKESIGAWAWSNENDNNKVIEILKEMGLRHEAHTYSKEADRDYVLTEMNAICEILKTVKQQGLIVDSKTYDEVNEVISQEIRLKPATFLTPNMLDIFFEKLEKQSGIIISDEMKDRIKESKEKIELESGTGYVVNSVINQEGEEVTIVDSNYNIALKNLCKEISDCCLYPKKQEIIIDEWINQYKNLDNLLGKISAIERKTRFIELANMIPTEIFEDEQILHMFFSKIEESSIIIGDNEKKIITQLTSDIRNSKELEEVDKIVSLKEKIAEYCLLPYPKKQEVMIDEWIIKYQELEELNSNQLKDTDKEFKELSKMIPTEIFEDEMLIKIFLTKTLSNDIEISEDTIELVRNILNDKADFEKDGFVRTICKNCSQKEIASRILSKKLEDKIISEKKFTDLSFDEKEYINVEMQKMSISEAYIIDTLLPNDIEKSPVIISDFSFGEFSERIKYMPFVIIDEKNEFEYKTSFLPIQEKETVGKYMKRMGECVSLIDRYIRGEDIEFNEYGQSVETTLETIQTEQSRQNLLESAIEATIDAKITTEEKDTAKKTIISIENAKNRENEIYQNNGEISN